MEAAVRLLLVEDDVMLAEAVRSRDTGSSERGSGIGLSLVSRIAQLHGASLEVSEGIAGRGFAVTVGFPSEA